MSIEVQNISKKFAGFTALNNINLQINGGELLALLGPSGCGKTTLLRIIAGLEKADSGKIIFNGYDSTQTHVSKRQIGFVFQHYALFRHMTVFDNIAFGLNVKPRKERPSQEAIKEKVMSLLKTGATGLVGQCLPLAIVGWTAPAYCAGPLFGR